jgi:hypothetical protein
MCVLFLHAIARAAYSHVYAGQGVYLQACLLPANTLFAMCLASYMDAGHIVAAALQAQGHDLTQMSTAGVLTMPVSAALTTSELFTIFQPSASNACVQLDLNALLAEMKHGRSSSSSSSSSSSASQQPAAAAVKMPLPEQLQPLLNISAADCAAAEVVIISDQQEQQQHAKELSAVAQHLSAARLAALDVEYSWESTADSSTVSSTASSIDEEDEEQLTGDSAAAGSQSPADISSVDMPAEHNCFQQQLNASFLKVALLSLMVPAAETSSSSWPAAIYLIQVPQQPAAAQQVFSLLLPQLEDEAIVKVVHDARQVCAQP